MGKINKIGHRGAKAHLAENTLESIAKAIDLGVDMIEIDVHRCASGELYVIHDFTLDRTTDGSGEIAKKTSSQLQEMLIEERFRIPTLLQVLELIENKCQINIELKGRNTARAVSEIIKDKVEKENWEYGSFLVSSFQKNELFEVRKINSRIPLAVLSKASVPEAIELGKKLDAVAIHPSVGIITRDNTKLCQDQGFQVNVWTVNEVNDILRMIDFGVDGIISDFPDRLKDPVKLLQV
ncbi:glycerophosphodiester phosphodiesterase [Christiangramia portivictoriae]|uniref:glycerophosphodiester phosphodiesterase n=1 Tax=Christiangramia portivictoriae TaxID=326069 RepID=UPI0004130786|nr:glycerophosphodiester phosphodiesterase family protein [Christiangramia portivictoriae]